MSKVSLLNKTTIDQASGHKYVVQQYLGVWTGLGLSNQIQISAAQLFYTVINIFCINRIYYVSSSIQDCVEAVEFVCA